ncbi:MAG: hypothetical protein G01um10148_773 [Parcubacteria group bacterium Gr01-1014_8]|nr:MAG: hypothetical protein G01um10148_773 [Parcubacteria group bacterium Gr01-1014_8]
MVFEEQRQLEATLLQVRTFVSTELQSRDQDVSPQERWRVIRTFCERQNIDSATANGLNLFMNRAGWANKRADLEEALTFAAWLKDKLPDNFFGRGNLVYLADQDTPVERMFSNMKANYNFWSGLFGKDMFATSDEPSWRGRILKNQLSLPGYYFSVKGQSGSGTFSIDLAIGYDPRNVSQSTHGEMWRVGVDMEITPSGERVFRIVRTGSGHKSHGKEERLKELKTIRDDFLDKYKVSPQRLLLFLALQMGHDLGFDSAKGLSTQGATDISLLKGSKSPIDYTASMLDVGFTYKPESNWHEIHDLQNRFYSDIFAAHWHENPRDRKDVSGYTEVIRAFNEMTDEQGRPISFKLAATSHDLEEAWLAYEKIHSRTVNRERTGKRLGKQSEE